MAGDAGEIGAGAEGMGEGVSEEKRTAEQLVQLRAKMTDWHREHLGLEEGVVFTCDGCSAAHDCEFVFDPYNTDGDCLAEK